MEARSARRAVVTGLGLVTPVGLTTEETWANLLAGCSGAGPITQFDAQGFPVRFACEVKGFDPERYIDRKEVKRTDRYAQFALAAAAQAMAQAGLADAPAGLDPERFAVVLGSGIGGIQTFEEQTRRLLERGPERVSPFFVPMFIADMAAGLVSIRFGAKGPNFATVSACASSAHAVGQALRLIRTGEADVVLAGGSEASITPMAVAGFAAMKALSERNDHPTAASRPFDKDRDGFVMGEGAGVLVIEALEHAERRGAAVLAELVGFGQTADAYHITAPPPGHEGAARAMRRALEDAGLGPEDVDYINAHGTSTPLNDAAETAAIKAVFGPRAYELVVSSTKSMTGHTLGAAGGIEAAICVLACKEGRIPPTINYTTPDPECDLDYAPNAAVVRPVRAALSNSFGFGGHNAALVFRRWPA
jgi:3-oxoacyl-[acyl-carrier-protein] synthase II